ncbi:MAG: trypsin-like peptidase domain-containing protein [Holophagales bacterium]|nr:MAG: trypsin-like peptidase domain-containing protein [Holophagales bacterium]
MTFYPFRRTTVAFVTVCGLAALAPLAAQPLVEVASETAAMALDQRAAEAPPMRLADALLTAPTTTLTAARSAAIDQLAALRAWNAAGHLPVRTGFVRPLPASERVTLDAALLARQEPVERAGGWAGPTPRGDLAWGTWVRVDEAEELRLHLAEVNLPEGSRLWVWGSDGEARAFGLELRDEHGDLWTPSVSGSELFLEVALPAGSLAREARPGFVVRDVAESFALNADGSVAGSLTPRLGECIVDATCTTAATFPAIESVRSAIAQLQFVSGASTYVCSGQLINDTVTSTVVPYLLTARHCINTSSEAASLQARWDVRPASCGGATPGSFPMSNGATLLVSGASSDVTLLQLASFPGTRTLLGWTTLAPADGTTLHRISHPYVNSSLYPQSYSRTTVSTSFPACSDALRPTHIYSMTNLGGTFGGSSGSALLQSDGKIVGQLHGGCPAEGHDGSNGCDYANAEADGAFAQSYSVLQPYLSPSASGPCVPDATTLCIDRTSGDKRFKVTVTFSTVQSGGLSGSARAIALTSLGVTKGGLFWFFGADNPELLIKVLDGCTLNSRFWVYLTAGTNVGFTVQVTDTVTGAIRVYTNNDLTPHVPVQDTTVGLPCS